MSTKIEWADMTINPVVGCSHCSTGCDNCYAERFAARMAKNPNPKTAAKYRGVVDEKGWTGKINVDLSCLAKLPSKPQRIFVGSMCDLFHHATQYRYLDALFAATIFYPQHTFLLLTKRPENMRRYISGLRPAEANESNDSTYTQSVIWPELLCDRQWRFMSDIPGWGLLNRRVPVEEHWPLNNIWLGVTVCNQAEADEKIPLLLQTPAAKRFVSVEPMLGPIDLVGWGGIRQGENPYPERWPYFAWPEWVPAKVRQEIESFWSWETYKRTPRQWADNAVQNCGGIALGSLVGVDNVTWKGSKTVRPYNDYRSYRTGRFVHAWNNMCRVVYDDGTFDYASYDGRFYLSEYCVPGTDKYRSLINWVICGGETGPGARPMHPDWVRSLRDQCQSAGTPYFFKSWGEWTANYTYDQAISTPGAYVDDTPFARVGKRRAGRLLDGVEYNQFPGGGES